MCVRETDQTDKEGETRQREPVGRRWMERETERETDRERERERESEHTRRVAFTNAGAFIGDA